MKQTFPADVMLLAAGYGKRLRPLTETVPKPLISVQGKTLIERNLEMIARAGFRRVFVNLFHLAEMLQEYLGSGERWGLKLVCVKEQNLLDTGGAIKNIEPLLKSDVLLTVNSDILLGADFDLRSVLENHIQAGSKPAATLVLRSDPDCEKYGIIGVDGQGRVLNYLGEDFSDGKDFRPMMYTGVQVLARRVFDYMPPRGSVFSITRDTHLSLLRGGEAIESVSYEGYWNDVGTPARLEQAESDLAPGAW